MQRWCSHPVPSRIAVAMGAFLAGLVSAAEAACLDGDGSAWLTQVGEHGEDAPVGAGPDA